MKLEVGMYVRTNLGIAKITEYKENKNFDNEFLLDKEIIDTHEDYYSRCLYDYEFYLDQVIKASHNIIDLIEVGDYVNGGQVREKTNDYIRISGGEFMWQYLKREEDIKSIVTKEIFSNVEYRVETN